ncbi:MAG: DUF362 domain-containing protein [Bacteroidales bacterium]|nr:DUF362 domain-containing protein [Bacteroidales bacterium]
MKKAFRQRLLRFFEFDPETGKTSSFRKPGFFSFIPFLAVGTTSLLWFLVRVIPKPSRATYPCMKVAMPLAYSFITWLVTMTASVLIFKKALTHFRNNRYKYAFLFLLIGIMISAGTLIYQAVPSAAMTSSGIGLFVDPLGPNVPIGTPKGVYPGRVVWIYDPDATNKNCTNSSHSDAYWLPKNCDQAVVDKMFSNGIKSLTGKETHAEAWDAVFRYFNINHGKGDTGYVSGETLFIKINAVTAWSGAEPDGEMPSYKEIEYDTSPQAIMALLRQLVNQAGIPQQYIYIGDPMCDIWNTLYDYFYAEFPNIKYASKRNVTNRTKITASTVKGITYSDKGTVMGEDTETNYFFTAMMDADYLLNVPVMKGHRWGGVTFFAKNHFGSNTCPEGSWRLHEGLMRTVENGPVRTGYRLYRVFVDLMACKYLGGNTLLYYMDALWSTSYEHQKPQKYQTPPFNNDWTSSLMFSLDPVAIESVCLDIMQKEFTEEDLGANPPRYTFVQWEGVDDYLHQAASSEWWPEGITYDPDNSGTPISSLGVHEHWNNTVDMQYSRNLATGEGIELIKIFTGATAVEENAPDNTLEVFPNPVTTHAIIRFHLDKNTTVKLEAYSLDGKRIQTLLDEPMKAGDHSIEWYPGNQKGICILKLSIKGYPLPQEYLKKIEVM